MRRVSLFLAFLLSLVSPAFADVSVSSPVAGNVVSPFHLVAVASPCSGQPIVSMGYSLDTSTSTTIFMAASVDTQVIAPLGPHVLHVKSWGSHGVNCTTNVNINVVPAPDITVAAPGNGATVVNPFTVSASSTSCSGMPTVSMGYSFDDHLAVIEPAPFSVTVTATSGAHLLHVKCWGQGTHNEVVYNINVIDPPPAATPQLSLASGSFPTKQMVTISDATPGATIHYTTDGTAPNSASPTYLGPITIARTTTVQAMAIADGYLNSGFARADYTITGPYIPDNAIAVNQIQSESGWRIRHDPGTPGTGVGQMIPVTTPTLTGSTVEFFTQYSYWGGVLYSNTYGNDPNAQNFLYDVNVWIAPGSQLANLEMDNNQVLPNGDTVIFAFQCAGTSNTWDYTANLGTPSSPQVAWLHSNAPCNPAKWTAGAWHHVQISYSRDLVGNVTYHSVWLDDVEAPINATVNSDFSLGWATGSLIANFQVDDGSGTASSTIYVDNLTLYRW